jgi:hypothetical protein
VPAVGQEHDENHPGRPTQEPPPHPAAEQPPPGANTPARRYVPSVKKYVPPDIQQQRQSDTTALCPSGQLSGTGCLTYLQSGRLDLNQRPSDPQSDALARLRHAPRVAGGGHQGAFALDVAVFRGVLPGLCAGVAPSTRYTRPRHALSATGDSPGATSIADSATGRKGMAEDPAQRLGRILAC